VIVHYANAHDTVRSFESLRRSELPDHAVIVVANAATPEELQQLHAALGPHANLIRLPENRGFAAAANEGIRRAVEMGAEYVWILNNDTVVDEGALSTLVDAMDSEPTIGIASPQIRSPVGHEAPVGIWYAGGSLSMWRSRAKHRTEALTTQHPAVDVSFVTGCAMMIRRSVFRTVGLFWEDLFLYWEDADMVLRARKKGWRTCVVPQAWIYHEVHGAASEPVASYFLFRNAPLVAWRNGSALTVVSSILFTWLRVARRWIEAIAGRRAAPVQATVGALAGLRVLASWIGRRSRAEGIETI